jgi:hypothetical protein
MRILFHLKAYLKDELIFLLRLALSSRKGLSIVESIETFLFAKMFIFALTLVTNTRWAVRSLFLSLLICAE